MRTGPFRFVDRGEYNERVRLDDFDGVQDAIVGILSSFLLPLMFGFFPHNDVDPVSYSTTTSMTPLGLRIGPNCTGLSPEFSRIGEGVRIRQPR
jgi:hypothetical protein